jgi:hypothetical protein
MVGRALRIMAAAALLAGAAAAAAPGAAGGPQGGERRQASDLASMVAADYAGDVISDARGESRSGVRITVTRIGPNRVRVTSDYARLPAFEARLERVMDTIQNADGDPVFLLDLNESPQRLMITVDDASWAGVRE